MGKSPLQLPGKPREFEIIRRARRAPPHPCWFTPAEVTMIAHTVRRAPEVMIKVTGGGMNAGAVSAHLTYIGRRGELEVEIDDGQRLRERSELKALLEEWRLDLTSGQYRPKNRGRVIRSSKLVHNIVLSMPSRTPPDKVLTAAKKFARERFALQYRYALVLHDDQANPHVHLVVKAESESGQRLHIDTAMLRDWREQFAELMRQQGIAANATPRAVRGKNPRKGPRGLFAAREHGKSTIDRRRVEGVARDLRDPRALADPARRRLLETRKSLVERWDKVAKTLEDQGERTLAAEVRAFVEQLPVVATDRQKLAIQLLEFKKNEERAKERDGMRRDAMERGAGREEELTR